MKGFLSAILFASFLSPFTMHARSAADSVKKVLAPVEKFYIANGLDGLIFSTATIDRPGKSNYLGTMRFTGFLHLGITLNYNFTRHIGAYTGLDLKNIGFIEQHNGETTKRRTYNLGIPIGLRIGNMAKTGKYGFIGGGVDMPISYKEKRFVIRSQKTERFTEWFSDRTPFVMPYVFAGAGISQGFTLKVQYYPTNYLNPDFTTNGSKPYAGYDVQLVLFSIGYSVPTRFIYKKHDPVIL